VLAEQLLAEARPDSKARVVLPFALARRPSLPIRPPIEGKPLRQLLPHLFTFAGAVARQREARSLVLNVARGRPSIPLKDVMREIILLRVLGRIRQDGGSADAWSLSVENDAGTVLIRTHAQENGQRIVLPDGPIERVAWNHSAIAQFVPVYPRHPSWGWIALGVYGRYEFTAIGEVARTDPAAAKALLAQALEQNGRGYDARRFRPPRNKR
jgi:hypothetical protein